MPPKVCRAPSGFDKRAIRARALHGALTCAAAVAAAAAVAPAGVLANGGTVYVPSPKPSKVKCVASCMSKSAVRGGGSLKVSGRSLARVKKVIFTGGRGKRDDIEVPVDPSSDRVVKVKVPMGARSGPLMLWAADRAKAKTRRVKVMPPPPPIASAELTPSAGPSDPGAPGLETGTSHTQLIADERGGVEFKYRVGGDAPVRARVQLVRQNDGSVAQTWDAPSVQPGTVQSLRWEGKNADGSLAPEGRYIFVLHVVDGSGLAARSAGAANPQRDAFDFRHFVFPIKGAHNYGQSGARFGAGRTGRSHQGQDVMAKCGTKLVAARGGIVKVSGYHSAAGNYVVIDNEGDDQDFSYMHMRDTPMVDKGERVYSNQQIGVVGSTGSSTACHLHFEMWTAPGWYDGGDPVDPLAALQAWDSYS